MPGRMTARAFCPGHITGLFIIKDKDKDFERKGSLGAGLSLTRGAMSSVSLTMKGEQQTENAALAEEEAPPAEPDDGTEKIKIFINGKEEEAPVTRAAVTRLLEGSGMDATVQTRLELPVGQGLGMSAAGAFSTALAICRIMCIPEEDALRAAHYAEIKNGTGLGDAVAQSVGGLEVRRVHGLPPIGEVQSVKVQAKVYLCVLEGERSTAKILRDAKQRKKINSAGEKWYAKLGTEPELRELMTASYGFAKESGLMSKTHSEICSKLWKAGHMASLTMLGNTIFCVPGGGADPTAILSNWGRVYELEIENKPARLFG